MPVVAVEQPLAAADHAGQLELRSLTDIPVIADEAVATLADLDGLEGLADAVNIKLTKCGGLQQARMLADEARHRGMDVMLGCLTASTLGIAPAVHLAGRARWADLDGHLLLAHDPWTGIGGADGGCAARTPGLGVRRSRGGPVRPDGGCRIGGVGRSRLRRFPLAVRLLLVNQLGVNTGFYLLIPYPRHPPRPRIWACRRPSSASSSVSATSASRACSSSAAPRRTGWARGGVIIAGCALRTVGFALFALGDGLPVLLSPRPCSAASPGRCSTRPCGPTSPVAGAERRAEAFALFNVFATGRRADRARCSAARCCSWTSGPRALTAAAIFAALTVAQAGSCPPGRWSGRRRCVAGWGKCWATGVPGVRPGHGRHVHP